ncbi:MAG: tRNA (adenosine(37)-N6)-threonylcarbamoyltransferase complex dimerization subunit type 1 TsaB [Cohaesibacteraceae bacterium]|nr:tRNA (adenosine(37)-N6)-threonylcarbamoyltransferase complex dimerization subunit type 1 TsaB [Cohaesibacteraceae bacterium]
MRILAIDTSLKACSVAIIDFGETVNVLAKSSVLIERSHAERLMGDIETSLLDSQTDYDGLDRIVVCLGPGSFTGMRVGIAAARGIAFASGKQCVGVTSLAGFIDMVPDAGTVRLNCAVIDARRDELYFQIDAGMPQVGKINVLADQIERRPVILCGNAAHYVADNLHQTDCKNVEVMQCISPDIENIAALGYLKTVGSKLPEPVYIRSPDAKKQTRTIIEHQLVSEK